MDDPAAAAADPVGRVLNAARQAPGGPPAGLADALAAFGRGDPPRRENRTGAVWRRALATTLTTKLVVGATAAAAAAAGITVAVTVPHHDRPSHPGTPTSATSGAPNGGSSSKSRSGPSASTSNPSGPSAPASGASSTGVATTTSGAPQPSFAGLCRAWPADVAQQQQRGRSPAFAALVRAAGGTGRVTSYCVQVVGVVPHPSAIEKRRTGPSTTSRPTHPSTKPAPTLSPTSPTN